MSRPKKKIIAHFYKTLNGTEPVRDWLLKLGIEDRKTVGADFLKSGVISQISVLRVLFLLSRMMEWFCYMVL